MNLYARKLKEYGVYNHPQEVLCEAMEKVLTKRFLKVFKS
jgi:hypothetical protein